MYAVLFAVLLLELANEKYHVRCFFIKKKNSLQPGSTFLLTFDVDQVDTYERVSLRR